MHCCSLSQCRVRGRPPPPSPAPAVAGHATAADGRLRSPSRPPLVLRYCQSTVIASCRAGRGLAGLVGRGAVSLSSSTTVAEENTRILERKPLINTSHCIQHRLELKFLHCAQFLLMLIEQLIDL